MAHRARQAELERAVYRGDDGLVMSLVASKVGDVNAPLTQDMAQSPKSKNMFIRSRVVHAGSPLLHVAMLMGNIETALALLDNGADIEATGTWVWNKRHGSGTVLDFARARGRENRVFLLQQHAEPQKATVKQGVMKRAAKPAAVSTGMPAYEPQRRQGDDADDGVDAKAGQHYYPPEEELALLKREFTGMSERLEEQQDRIEHLETEVALWKRKCAAAESDASSLRDLLSADLALVLVDGLTPGPGIPPARHGAAVAAAVAALGGVLDVFADAPAPVKAALDSADALDRIQEAVRSGYSVGRLVQLRERVIELGKFHASYEQLADATNDFDAEGEACVAECRLGHVFRVTADGEAVAVKRVVVPDAAMWEGNVNAQRQLQRELETLGSLEHQNVLPLLTSHVLPVPVLVTPWQEHGSLEEGITDLGSCGVRVRVLQGIAHGLSYLHEMGVLHRHLTPRNVILGGADGTRPMLTDMGLHNLGTGGGVPGDDTTDAFTCPNYALTHEFAPASDVFSLGVVILVVVTGQPAVSEIGSALQLRYMVEDAFDESDSLETAQRLGDPAVEWPMQVVHSLLHLGLRCVRDRIRKRPSLDEVCAELGALLDDELSNHE